MEISDLSERLRCTESTTNGLAAIGSEGKINVAAFEELCVKT